jgi:hypothetical protein
MPNRVKAIARKPRSKGALCAKRMVLGTPTVLGDVRARCSALRLCRYTHLLYRSTHLAHIGWCPLPVRARSSVLRLRLSSYEAWRRRALSRPQAPLLLTVMAETPLSSLSANDSASSCAATGVNRQSSIRGQGRAPREGRNGHVSHTAAGKTRDGAAALAVEGAPASAPDGRHPRHQSRVGEPAASSGGHRLSTNAVKVCPPGKAALVRYRQTPTGKGPRHADGHRVSRG